MNKYTTPKIKNAIQKQGISQMMQSNYSLQKIQEELDKCVCLCSNCHRRVHAGTLTLRM